MCGVGTGISHRRDLLPLDGHSVSKMGHPGTGEDRPFWDDIRWYFRKKSGLSEGGPDGAKMDC